LIGTGRFITGKRNKLDKSKDILIIPRHQVTLRFIEVPSLDQSELKSMVEFQALKESPYSKEEIVTGFRNIGSYKKGFSYIMLAIVKKQLIEDMIAQRGSKPENIRLETESLYLYLVKRTIVKQDKTVMVINIQKDYSEVMIIDKTRPVFSRSIINNNAWLEEINRSIVSYRRDRNSREIEEAVIMHGSGLSIENIKSGIETSFTCPVNFYEYKEDLNTMSLPLQIDLLPVEYIDKRLSRERIQQALVTYFLLFTALVMLASFFAFKIRGKNNTILILSREIDKMQKDVDQLQIFLKKTEALKSQQEEGERVINALKECYELAPQEVSIAGLDYDASGVLYCKGVSRDMSGVFNFIKILEKSRYFKKAEVKYATKKQSGNQVTTDFSIACFKR
jgi:Tfp pilus assembly protein PilN